MVDVNELTVIVLPTKVGPADAQLRRERRVAGEECTCLLSGQAAAAQPAPPGLPMRSVPPRIAWTLGKPTSAPSSRSRPPACRFPTSATHRVKTRHRLVL